MTTQQCTHCHEIKPLDDFSPSRGTTNGRLKRCRKCWSMRKNELYKIRRDKGAYGRCIECDRPLSAVGRGRKKMLCKGCRSGQNAYNYKGGHLTDAGYVMVKRKDGSNTFKHRVVMEEYLGRRLNPDETVHHRNGVRDDNRIENLELWVGAHPRGLKIPDAIAWAKEILERYKDV